MKLARPPLNEVVLSLQSEPITGLSTPYVGLFWQRVRARYPKVEVQPPLDPVLEQLDASVASPPRSPFKILEAVETPRCWFLSQDGETLIQLQQDRLVFNWRRVEKTAPYPRYERLRPEFERHINEFATFTRDEHLGPLLPNQCEISYINHIEAADWITRGELNRVLSFWEPAGRAGLPEPEDATVTLRFIVDHEGTPAGRLHVTVKPAVRRSDNRPILVLDLTARGRPLTPDVTGALAFLDLGRAWIHRAFESLTRDAARRQLWGAEDD